MRSHHAGAPGTKSQGPDAFPGFPVNALQHRLKHGLRRIAPVVPERVLVEVVLQVLGADRVVDASHTVLEQAEKPLDRLGVRVPIDVDARFVPDSAVAGVALGGLVVDGVLVREDHRGR